MTIAAILLAVSSTVQAQPPRQAQSPGQAQAPGQANVPPPIRGAGVQVNEAKAAPTVEQLQAVINPGDFVRDVLGWHRVDRSCNLRLDPSRGIEIPAAMSTLYSRVAAAQGKNFVTLAFNNIHCAQSSNSGAKTFPNTDTLRAEFAAYAVAAVKQVPALGGLSIWNELNGTFSGGYKNPQDKFTNYCLLVNKVVTEVRKVDATVPIAIGASIGWDIDQLFIDLFGTYGCMGKGDPTIWLDVHPYLTGKSAKKVSDWQRWNDSIANIRAAGITNPLVATEWGGTAAYKWLTGNHNTGNYIETFESQARSQDPGWAALIWFELLYDKKVPHSTLFDKDGSTLTIFGSQYIAAFKH